MHPRIRAFLHSCLHAYPTSVAPSRICVCVRRCACASHCKITPEVCMCAYAYAPWRKAVCVWQYAYAPWRKAHLQACISARDCVRVGVLFVPQAHTHAYAYAYSYAYAYALAPECAIAQALVHAHLRGIYTSCKYTCCLPVACLCSALRAMHCARGRVSHRMRVRV